MHASRATLRHSARAPVERIDEIPELWRHDLGKDGVVARRRRPHVHEAEYEERQAVQRHRAALAVERQALDDEQAERDAHEDAELAREDAAVVGVAFRGPVADHAAHDAAQRRAALEARDRERGAEVREADQLQVARQEDERVPGRGAEDALQNDDLERRDARHLQRHGRCEDARVRGDP